MSSRLPDPKALLSRYRLRAKKSWGQHFLVSEAVYSALVAAAVASPDDWIVEFGAGLGTLTRRLAAQVPSGRVLAVERDRDLAAVLRAELGQCRVVEVVEENALTYDVGAASQRGGRRVVLCGNLPYHLASQILLRAVDARDHLERVVVMIQREVADRLLARPGSKVYGLPTVLITPYFRIELVRRVKPGAFVPRPRVDSSIIRLDPLPAPQIHRDDEVCYRDLVHGAFGQRRKTLRNALAARYGVAASERALEDANIAPRRRAETLSVAEFIHLAAALRQCPSCPK